MKTIEATGASVEEAIEAGLRQLNAKRDDVEFGAITQKGIFRKKYIVQMTLKEESDKAAKKAPERRPEEKVRDEKPREEKKPAPAPEKKAEKPAEHKPERSSAHFEKKQGGAVRPAPAEPVASAEPHEAREHEPRKVAESQVALAVDYLSALLKHMNIEATLETDTSHGSIDINIVTADTAVIGHRGEVLDALQILTKRAAEVGEDKFVHVNVDSHNYRVQREQSLVALAERMANKCIKTGRKVVLEPMSSTHRKIIHATLSGNDKVTTRSEGREPSRRVVIFPKRG